MMQRKNAFAPTCAAWLTSEIALWTDSRRLPGSLSSRPEVSRSTEPNRSPAASSVRASSAVTRSRSMESKPCSFAHCASAPRSRFCQSLPRRRNPIGNPPVRVAIDRLSLPVKMSALEYAFGDRKPSRLLCGHPVGGVSGFGAERHAQGHGALHLLADDPRVLLCELLRGLQHQFVVYLEQHLQGKSLRIYPALNAHHCGFDEVGGAALHDRVDRQPLSQRLHVAIERMNLRDGAASARQRADVALLARLPNALFQKRLNAGEAALVFRDQFGRGGNVYPLDPAGQAVGRNAVDDPEVDGLGAGALLPRHLLQRDMEDLRRNGRVNVLVGGERLDERRVFREVSEQAQFDLRIVG